MVDWYLECSLCGATREAEGLPTVCDRCGKPWLVRYRDRDHPTAEKASPAGPGMWRFRSFLPLAQIGRAHV